MFGHHSSNHIVANTRTPAQAGQMNLPYSPLFAHVVDEIKRFPAFSDERHKALLRYSSVKPSPSAVRSSPTINPPLATVVENMPLPFPRCKNFILVAGITISSGRNLRSLTITRIRRGHQTKPTRTLRPFHAT